LNKKMSINVRKMAIIGMLGAVSAVLGMTPLGFIPIGPTRATTMHIPVIIAAIMEGPMVGALVGLIFGIFSIYQAVANPTPVSFVFLNPIVSIIPRILIGVFTYYVFSFLSNIGNKKTKWLLYLIWFGIIGYLFYGIYKELIDFKSVWTIVFNMVLIFLSVTLAYFTIYKHKNMSYNLIIPAMVGTLTNTFGVLSSIYIFYGERFVEAMGGNIATTGKIILGIGLTNGIPETIIAIIVVTSVVGALKRNK